MIRFNYMYIHVINIVMMLYGDSHLTILTGHSSKSVFVTTTVKVLSFVEYQFCGFREFGQPKHLVPNEKDISNTFVR